MIKRILYTYFMNIDVYSDGSCFNEDSIGGWGVYMIIDKNKTVSFSGCAKCKNSITMELLAVSKAFEYINSFFNHIETLNVKIYTDCDYIVKLIRKKEKTNRNTIPIRDKTTKQNKQIIFDICNNQKMFSSIRWILIRAHSGIKGNELADKLARSAAKKIIQNNL